MTPSRVILAAILLLVPTASQAQTPRQPKVFPGPGEPDWSVVLKGRYGLDMYADLLNPVITTAEATPGLFRKAGPGPVRYTPEIALGMETTTRGGWYRPGPSTDKPARSPLWAYTFKNTTADLEGNKNLPPPLDKGSLTTFDPGDQPFGLTISNDNFDDGGAFSQPAVVSAVNRRLSKQPYKMMLYSFRERATGKVVPHSYLIGWEYSTNDDFQDAVCRVDNVELVTEPGKP